MNHREQMQETTQPARYEARALRIAVDAMFRAGGLEAAKAQAVTDALVTADMMGHHTHGLALAPMYLDALASGALTRSGEVGVIADRGACITWDGRLLPGSWLISQALDLAADRAAQYGVVTVSIRNSQHTGALAVYLPPITRRGLMAIIACSGPNATGVAPYGGMRTLFTPNPLAAGIPTRGDPILLDISASITTNNRARQLARAGGRFPAPWGLDAQGQPTDDPAAIINGGSLLPIGGLDHGHKVFSLALLIEALTQGVNGFGRSDKPSGTITSVFIQVIDPGAFGGLEAYKQQTSWLADACRNAEPRPGVERVRVPGQAAAEHQRDAERNGVPLSQAIVAALAPYAERLNCPLPPPSARGR